VLPGHPASDRAGLSGESVGHGDPAAERLAILEFVGERDREIGDANPALAGLVDQQLVSADPELAVRSPGPIDRAGLTNRSDTAALIPNRLRTHPTPGHCNSLIRAARLSRS
jgi:hypothetical protein